jgi:ADP-heptose:LPS heptosyltransferase/GT2 family glycosyltransferase
METLNVLISSTRQWNPGDEFILFGVQNLLTEVIKNPINWVLYDRNPDLFIGGYDYAVQMDKFWTNAYCQNDYSGFDIAVIAGTSEWFGRPLEKFYRLVREYKIPLIVIGAGYYSDSPINFTEDELYCLSELAQIITVRDSYASKALDRISVKHSLLPCPALFAASEHHCPNQIQKVGFILQANNTLNQRIPLQLTEAGYEAAIKLQNTGLKVDMVTLYTDEFVAFSKRQSLPVRYSYDSNHIINMLKEYDAVVSTRLHGAIAANSLGKPAIMFNEDPRCVSAANLFPHISLSKPEDIIDQLEKIDVQRLKQELPQFKSAVKDKYVTLLQQNILINDYLILDLRRQRIAKCKTLQEENVLKEKTAAAIGQKSIRPYDTQNDLQTRFAQRNAEINQLREDLKTKSEQRQQEIAELQDRLDNSEAKVEQRQQEITGLNGRLNESDTALKAIHESFGWAMIQHLDRLSRRVFYGNGRRYKLWILIRKGLAIWIREGFRSFIVKLSKKLWSMGPGALTKGVSFPRIRRPSTGPRKESRIKPVEQISASEKSKVWICNDCPRGDAEFVSEITGVVDVSGWAVAEKGISVVSVYCDDQLQGIASYGSTRVDVGAAYPKIPHSASSGYHFIWDSSKLSNDIHVLKTEARSTDGNSAVFLARVRVSNTRTAYERWQERNMVSPSALRWMKSVNHEFAYRPRISLLLFQQASEVELFSATLSSLLSQAYPDWELCVACDTRQYEITGSKLTEIAQTEPRVKILVDDFQNKAQAWNKLLAKSDGELVGVIDEGDRLQCHALFETVYQFNLKKDTDIIYSDEDVILSNYQRVQPSFKPGWSPDLLFSMNYIGRLWIARRSLVLESGGFRENDGEASEYGFLLRLVEKTDRIASLKTVLYSRWWANRQDSPQQTEKVLQETMNRRGIGGEVRAGPIAGTYRVKRDIKGQPMVSLIIPTKGNLQYLRPCLESITSKSTYPNYEIIIIDNNSALPDETSEYYSRLPHKIIRWSQPFNWSRINNSAAKEAAGDYLLFLNDDTEVIAPEWIEALLEHAQRPEVAAVGAKLLYADGTVQHAGMFLVDHGGGARHAFRHLQADNPGYLGLASVQRNCSVVTGACLMIRRKVFEDLGGFNEELAIASNDADFCLRALQKGYQVVYTPFALLYHHEKVTRKDISEEEGNKKFWQLWSRLLEQGDHYYNPNLSLESDLFDINERQLSITYADWLALERDEIKKILVVKLDHLGDVILSLPAIRRLKQAFPDADITALVGSWSKPFLVHESAVDRILTYDGFFNADSSTPPKQLTAKEKQEIAKWLAGYGFDLALDLRRHTETREFLALSGARYTAGFANFDEFPWLTIALPYERDQRMYRPRHHISQDLVGLVEFTAAGSDVHLSTAFSTELQQSAENLLKSLAIPDNRLIIGIHPGVGQTIRRWPIEYFARCADLLCERLDATVLVFGTKNEKKLADRIIGKMHNKGRAFSLAGEISLDAFLYVLKKCDLFIGNNSGPIHMAASLGVPTVGVYAGTSHVKEWGPIGPQALAVHLEMGCSPCYLVHHADCPYDIACLKYIHPEQVWQAALRLLIPKWRSSKVI